MRALSSSGSSNEPAVIAARTCSAVGASSASSLRAIELLAKFGDGCALTIQRHQLVDELMGGREVAGSHGAPGLCRELLEPGRSDRGFQCAQFLGSKIGVLQDGEQARGRVRIARRNGVLHAQARHGLQPAHAIQGFVILGLLQQYGAIQFQSGVPCSGASGLGSCAAGSRKATRAIDSRSSTLCWCGRVACWPVPVPPSRARRR